MLSQPPKLPLRFRPLSLEDLPALMAIEEQVFRMPWPASVYRRELTRNDQGLYYALELTGEVELAPAGTLLGYAGAWLLGDEAHLMTIAVAREWQGLGLGEWLLLELLDAVEADGARAMTLEVRVGNRRAISLYRRLRFRVVGRRRRYYADNLEDALIMTTPLLDEPQMLRRRAQRRRLVSRRLGAALSSPVPRQ